MCQIWLQSDSRVEKKGGTRQTDKGTLQHYIVDYTWIGSAFNKLSENIYFYMLSLVAVPVVFDLLRATAEYLLWIKNGIS